MSFVSTFSIFSEDFERAISRSDGEPSVVYVLHYKISYERNYVLRILIKRGHCNRNDEQQINISISIRNSAPKRS